MSCWPGLACSVSQLCLSTWFSGSDIAYAAAQLKAPCLVLQVEASLASQLWRGVRFCLSLLVGLTVLTVVFEDKGLGRGMLNNPDMRPEQVSNVRFGDVKGVDEAKVWGACSSASLTAPNACGAVGAPGLMCACAVWTRAAQQTCTTRQLLHTCS